MMKGFAHCLHVQCFEPVCRIISLSRHFMHTGRDQQSWTVRGGMMRSTWMNGEVRIKTSGGPEVPDPSGQNTNERQQKTCLNVSFSHSFSSTFSLSFSVRWIIYTVRQIISWSDYYQPTLGGFGWFVCLDWSCSLQFAPLRGAMFQCDHYHYTQFTLLTLSL